MGTPGAADPARALGAALTDQELRVAVAVARGATNKAVARELEISVKTVEYHLANVYRKLGLGSRAELAHLVGTQAVSPPDGTVSFLVTALDDPPPSWTSARRRLAVEAYERVVTRSTARWGGFVVDLTRDGYAAAFASPVDAAAAAGACLVEARAVGDLAGRARAGVHTGLAHMSGGVYLGSAVRRATLVAEAARAGQVVASAAATALLREAGWRLRPAGTRRLADVDRAEELSVLAVDGLPDDGAPLRPASTVGNLPRTVTGLIGRADELELVGRTLDGASVVSLVGPGGVGKTALALALAGRVADRFAHGAWLVELAPVVRADDVVAAVATALGLRLPGRVDVATLASALDGPARLLVLDNCEHILGAVRSLATTVVERAPAVRVLLTSRERLGVHGEHVVTVAPLPVDASNGTSMAAALFHERAAAVLGTFDPDAAGRALVEHLVTGLEGLPLAVELAAARLSSLGLPEVAAGLADRLELLRRQSGGRHTRHHSLRAAIAWSYDALDPAAQQLFEGLSVFVGGFDERAAAAVVPRPTATSSVLDGVRALVDKSLLTEAPGPAGPRFDQLETIRQFGTERLRARRADEAARRSSLTHYVAVAEEADVVVRSSDELPGHRLVLTEWANLRHAMAAAVAFDDGDAAARLVRSLFWWAMSRARVELGDWATSARALPSLEHHPLRPVVTACASYFALMAGEVERSAALCTEALDEERRLGPATEPWVQVVQSFNVTDGDFFSPPREVQRRGADVPFWRVLGSQQECAVRAGIVAYAKRPDDEVVKHLARIAEARQQAEELGNANGVAYATMTSGLALVRRDQPAAARLLRQAIDIAAPLELEITVAQARRGLAALYAELGRPHDALDLVAPAIEQHLRTGASAELWVAVASALQPLAVLGRERTAARALGALQARPISGLQRATPLGDLEARLTAALGEDGAATLRADGAHLSLIDAAHEVRHAIPQAT